MDDTKFKVVYPGGAEFILTSEEINIAKDLWKNGEPFWCERHRASLTKYYTHFEALRLDISERRELS